MLLSAVSALVVAQSSSEISEGLMNNPVYMRHIYTYICIYIYIYMCVCVCVCVCTYSHVYTYTQRWTTKNLLNVFSVDLLTSNFAEIGRVDSYMKRTERHTM